jgi:hypothetical protein
MKRFLVAILVVLVVVVGLNHGVELPNSGTAPSRSCNALLAGWPPTTRT